MFTLYSARPIVRLQTSAICTGFSTLQAVGLHLGVEVDGQVFVLAPQDLHKYRGLAHWR